MNYRGFGRSFWQNKVTPLQQIYILENPEKPEKSTQKIKSLKKLNLFFHFQIKV